MGFTSEVGIARAAARSSHGAGDFTAGILASGGVDWGVAAYFGSMAGVGAALLIVGAVVGIRARHRGAPVAS
jgi:hypothetical protein